MINGFDWSPTSERLVTVIQRNGEANHQTMMYQHHRSEEINGGVSGGVNGGQRFWEIAARSTWRWRTPQAMLTAENGR